MAFEIPLDSQAQSRQPIIKLLNGVELGQTLMMDKLSVRQEGGNQLEFLDVSFFDSFNKCLFTMREEDVQWHLQKEVFALEYP